jgi:SNF2 family DNA or RNA helicase
MPEEVTYKTHQKDVAKKLQGQHGILVYHVLGSGKTLSSIFAADKERKPTTVVVPASLQDNFKKEVSKAKSKSLYDIFSYEKFTKKQPGLQNRTLIVDEAHRLRNADAKRTKAIEAAGQQAKKVMLLTGTPIQNKPHEIAPLINTVAGDKRLPENEKEFNSRYITKRMDHPGFLSRVFLGAKPGVTYSMQNKRDFAGRVKGLVSYYKPAEPKGYPSVEQYEVYSPMSERQHLVYRSLERKLPKELRYKIHNIVPPEKQDTTALNSFMSAVRQISNTSKEFDVEAPEQSPKLQDVMDKIKKSKGPALVYSNYLRSGVYPLANLLAKSKIPHGVYTGNLSSKEKSELVKQYNKGKLKTLIVSSSGGEGLDLKGTRQVHILEPHWHEEKINQVIGRAARLNSHEHLPPRHRKVDVYKYYSTFPKKEEPRIYKWLGIKAPDKRSVDEYLNELSKRKKQLNDQFLNVLKES